MSIPSNHSFEHYFQIALSFSTVKLGLLAVRHPIHLMQTHKQASPLLSNTQIISEIYQNHGIRGFYRSTGTAILKICLSESYRGLLMLEVPREIRSHLPNKWSHSTTTLTTSALATPIISAIDSIFICPVVRMGTLQMTNKQNFTLKATYNQHIKGNLFTLYRGFTPLFVQTSILWGNFLLIDDLMKWALQSYFHKVSYLGLAGTSFIGGSIVTCINVVPDTIRVRMQTTTTDLSMRATALQLVRECGTRALFATVPHKLFSGIIGYGYKSILRHFWTTQEDK